MALKCWEELIYYVEISAFLFQGYPKASSAWSLVAKPSTLLIAVGIQLAFSLTALSAFVFVSAFEGKRKLSNDGRWGGGVEVCAGQQSSANNAALPIRWDSSTSVAASVLQ